ncbi:MAG: hypothetical protein ACRD2L_03770, partial [Terriglobia bacterium]
PESQGNLRPGYLSLLKARMQMAGADVPEGVLEGMLASPDLSASFNEFFNDKTVWNPQEIEAGKSRLSQARTSGDDEKVVGAMRAEKDAQVQASIQSILPEIVKSRRKGTDTLSVTDLMLDPEVKSYLGQSPVTKRVFNQYIANKDNKEFLANIGLDVSGVERQKLQVEGPKMTAEGAEVLAGMFTDSQGKPLTPANATSGQISKAHAMVASEQLKQKIMTGVGVADAMLDLPAEASERDKHIDIQAMLDTGDVVLPKPGITNRDLRQGSYRVVNDSQKKAAAQMKPALTAFNESHALSSRLVTANNWTDAITQGLQRTIGGYTGANKEAAAYLASREAITSYMARLVESGVMTNEDIT